MKKLFLILTLLGGWMFNAAATVSGPDNIVYGTITLGGSPITAVDTNFFVAARFTANGPPIATYTMGSLPSAGDYYSLRISVETVGTTSAPNAVMANQLIYIDVDDKSGIRAQTSLRVGPPGQVTLLNFGGTTFTPSSSGALTVTLLPAAVVLAEAQWQVDGGALQTNGAVVTNLAVGNHTVSFTSVSNWITPSSQMVSVPAGGTATASGIYTQPSAGLTLVTNGFGTIAHSKWPANLVVGKSYQVTAVAAPKNVFVSWVGGTNQPYVVLSKSPTYTFTMQSNLLLEANFATNVFMASSGTYRGLFAPTNAPRQQTNSGAFLFSLNSSGTASGSLMLGSQTVPFSAKFAPDGSASLVTKATHTQPSLAIGLLLDYAGQTVSGYVSNSAFFASLEGNKDAFGRGLRATDYEGQYTMAIAGATNPAQGPFGTSYAVVKVSSAGGISVSGSLADGTPFNQVTTVSQNGYWPMYIKLYGGKGSLWGWNFFASHALTSPAALSWINPTNSSKTAVYKSGFTNQAVGVSGGIYIPSQSLPSSLIVNLQQASPPAFSLVISNLASNPSELKMHTNKLNGMISGTFDNPNDPVQKIHFNGVILQGQTNAQGYFLGPNQSGNFSLSSP